MAAPTTPDEAIDQAVLGPQSVDVQGEKVVARPAADLIALAQHIANREAAANASGSFGLRFSKIIPPGGG